MSEKAWAKKEVIENYLRAEELLLPYREIQRQLACDLAVALFPDRDAPLRILDLGCGYGAFSERIVAAFPAASLACVDISPDMLALAKETFAALGERVSCHCLDFAGADRFSQLKTPVDLVVSGMAIHHLPHPAKKELFADIYRILRQPGLFINMDKVVYQSEFWRELEEKIYLTDMARRKSIQDGREWSLAEISAYYFGRPDAADDIELDLETQLDYLRQAGFQKVDTFFRYLKFTVFGAVK